MVGGVELQKMQDKLVEGKDKDKTRKEASSSGSAGDGDEQW